MRRSILSIQRGFIVTDTRVYITNVWNKKKMTGMDYISYLYTWYITVYIDIYKYIKKEM